MATILYPAADETIDGWSYVNRLKYRTTTLYQAINEDEQDGDGSYIYTVSPLSTPCGPYRCRLDPLEGHDASSTAICKVYAKGPLTATEASDPRMLLDPRCHTSLYIEVLDADHGDAVLGSRTLSLPKDSYRLCEFSADIPGNISNLSLRFTPRLVGGGTRYCRITQAVLIIPEGQEILV